MIKATDLRIGNYVQLENGKLCQLKQIGYVPEIKISNGCTVNDYSYDELYPIPLTQEILDKCGFRDGGTTIWLNEFFLWKSVVTDADFIFMYNGEIVTIKTLHHLQNLYYSLTNQELIYKL